MGAAGAVKATAQKADSYIHRLDSLDTRLQKKIAASVRHDGRFKGLEERKY